MISIENAGMEMIAFGFTFLLVILALMRFGRQGMEWIMMKLFEIFIQENPEGV